MLSAGPGLTGRPDVVFEARNDPKLLKFSKKTNIGTPKEYDCIAADVIRMIKKRIKNEKG